MVPLQGNESVIPEGWPLTLGRRGLVLQLGELEASALRLGECYLCIRSAVATTSGSGEVAAGDERNTVEIAVVWRTTSMRAPGFLGWDREEEFMDWREVSRKGQGSSDTASGSLAGPQSSGTAKSMRPRRRSREEARSRTREQGCVFEHRREETRSIDRLECKSSNGGAREGGRKNEIDGGHAVMKSRSTSSVGTWKAELETGESNGTRTSHSNHSSSLSGDESRAKTPLRLDEAVLEKKQGGAAVGEACRNIDTDDPLLGCRCAGDDCSCGEDTCDCSPSAKTRKEQSTRSFEIAGIKHIDSDDEEEVRMGFGTKKRVDDVVAPRTIHDIPEHVLTCGLTLPGCTDTHGRPVLEFEDEPSRREALSVKEVSSFLLYLARLPR
ncbi:hypothetical protein APICC_08558 [Apis cerana cerana]|uniref:Uncharacterized protein n=1 Tax=Apis cerana cerana TaxID=94128 RepID=A0A2A3E787_APICC|nr:hypothetical protein APICC_08558 [Apis cerana cerana]